MKIAIEGMDGVGKTTIAKRVAEDNGLLYIDKPLHYLFKNTSCDGYKDFMKLASHIYDVEDPAIRAWFFGLGNVLCFRKFKNQDFIVDRHLVSNYFWNGSEESNKVFESLINMVGVPDLTVLLYASPNTRLERLYLRDPYDRDITDPEKQVDGYDKMIKFVEDFNIPYIFVNTESKKIDAIVGEINEEINKLRTSKTNVPKVKKMMIKE